MKNALAIFAVAAVLAIGCTPKDQAAPDRAAAPATTPNAGEKITDMDFESGEVEQPAVQPEEPEAAEANPTPDVP